MAEIDDLLHRYREGFRTLDAELLSSLWADDEIVYCPAELAEPLTSKAEIDAYYENVATLFRDVEVMEVSGVRRQTLGEDAVIMYFDFEFRAHFVGGPEHSVAGRVSLALRRGAEGWRGVHYHESLALGGS